MNPCVSIVILTFAAWLWTTHGQESSGFTRDSAIRTAILNNRELSVAMLEIDRAKSRLRWAGRFTNPEFEINTSTDRIDANEGEGEIELAFSQRFPVTSRLADEKVVRQVDVELAEIEFQIRQRQLAFEVDKAWIELHGAQRVEKLQGRLLAVNKGIRAFMADRVKVGEISPLDAAQAMLNGKLIEQQLGIAKSTVIKKSARLRHLLSLDPESTVSIAPELPFPQATPSTTVDLQLALRNRPDYASLLASSDLGKAELSLAMAKRWDDITVKAFVQHEGAVDAPDGLERNSFAGVGLSIALPFHNRNQQAIEEAKIDIEKARRARSAKAFQIHSEFKAALEARKAAHELVVSAISDALPLAQKNFEAFQNAQQSGQASLLQVQQAQAQLIQLETSALELRQNFHVADAEVRFIAGTYPIPKKPLAVISK